jgi:primosomal protein N' (replication factor Y)
VARVIPDVTALDRVLDYSVPSKLAGLVVPGTIVRVPLHGRRVRGWVVGLVDRPETDRPLQPIAAFSGFGPSPELAELAKWAGWRWAGSRVTMLRTASPPRVVGRPPRSPSQRSLPGMEASGPKPVAMRVPPGGDALPLVLEVAEKGGGLVLAPSLSDAAYLAACLRAAGCAVALLPDDWANAASADCVAIGTRRAAWAPRPYLGGVIVLDEHDESYQEERTPTWNARDVVIERAARSGGSCTLVSPCPSLEALARAELVIPSRSDERDGWPVVDVADRRREPPGLGLYSERLVAVARQTDRSERVVCVLNRKGRARLLACAACGEIARCENCFAAVGSTAPGRRDLACWRCGTIRPWVCASCGSADLKVLRTGVSRAREELQLLLGRDVAEITVDTPAGPPPSASVIVGTEAVLHRVARAQVVAFLDFDQELLAPRYRAAERAFALLARAARILGGRSRDGRLLVQTRLPQHEVIDAAVHADPGRLAVVELARRSALRLPPEWALATVSGDGATEVANRLESAPGIDVSGPASGQWLLRAPDHETLCDALAALPRQKARTRLSVDPLRV